MRYGLGSRVGYGLSFRVAVLGVEDGSAFGVGSGLRFGEYVLGPLGICGIWIVAWVRGVRRVGGVKGRGE